MAAVVLPGFASRPLTIEDVDAVLEVFTAAESMETDGSMTTRDDIVASWARPTFHLETMSIGIEDESGRLVAAGEVYGERAEVAVHPDWMGRGIGTALAMWTWDVARTAGRTQVGQSVDDRQTAPRSLFETLGYRPRWTSWIFTIDVADVEPMPTLPESVRLRSFQPEDGPVVHRIIENAFNEWPDREPTSYEEWEATVARHAAFQPDASVVAEWDGEPVGIGIGFDYADEPDEGWIEQLAVAAPYRGQRLARAILTEMIHAFGRQGFTTVGVSTDSRTGARGLYERVGMSLASSYTRWSRPLED